MQLFYSQCCPYETKRRNRHGSGTAKRWLGHGYDTEPVRVFLHIQDTDTESESESDGFLHAESRVKTRSPCPS